MSTDNVVNVGLHWGAVDAPWVVEKREPDTAPEIPVALSGPMDTTSAVEVTEPEGKSRATRSTVSRNGNGSQSGTAAD